jgi:tRNA-splicing endonuclease subunit Sen15
MQALRGCQWWERRETQTDERGPTVSTSFTTCEPALRQYNIKLPVTASTRRSVDVVHRAPEEIAQRQAPAGSQLASRAWYNIIHRYLEHTLPRQTMEAHPSHPTLVPYLQKYARVAGALWQTFNDIALAQSWDDVALHDLPGCSRAAISGYRPAPAISSAAGTAAFKRAEDEKAPRLFVVPCSLAESLSASWIRAAFDELGTPPSFYLAICAEDSSVVYYKLNRGIVKPPL